MRNHTASVKRSKCFWERTMNSPGFQSALLVLDLINEVVHPDGWYGRDGYAEQVRSRQVLHHAAQALGRARAHGLPVIHVVVGFSESYAECPTGSSVLSVARQDRRLQLGTWATQPPPELAPRSTEPVVVKQRVSPFYQTNLELLLRAQRIEKLILIGVSTEFVVLATAMDAHDRDYHVSVIEEATAALDPVRHDAAVKVLRSTADVTTLDGAFANAKFFKEI
ncbi:MAG: cysteine hydrolase [Thiomonas arsenitoxydans]|uniref:Cysteine hydrolase n=3 Tax=Burkholderiales genera incertae sedis TaxID=224471 RepID=A0A8I1MVL4_THIA3|nr:cysteine hydrolase [Thiomonas arsenitoxydans]